MGIAPYVAEAIIREHKYRRIDGDVLLLGRQSMLFSPADAIAMIRGNGLTPANVAIDDSLLDTRTRSAQGRAFIRDAAFFRLLGIETVRALDYSAYEGAELTHDLSTPIPDALESTADFVVDGSTLDNLFNPAMALHNAARMLRPGGRLLAANTASAHGWPYVTLTPYWFLDFFAVNGFADSRVYLTLHGRRGELDVFAADPARTASPTFIAVGEVGVVAFAEKGAHSTWQLSPVQRTYAGEDLQKVYAEAAARFAASSRPELLVSGARALRFSPARMLTEHYRMMHTIAAHFPAIDGEGRRRAVRTPPGITVARWLRDHLRG
jgi:hypothetical protein